MSFKKLLLTATLTAAALAPLAPASGAAGPDVRPFGDVQVLGTFPTPPGFPEGIAVRGNKAYVAGPARFGTAGTGPSAVVAFDITSGDIVRTYDTQGEQLAGEHANSCVAFDGQGRLYVLNTQLGVYRLDTGSGVQESYSSPFPDLQPCSAAAPPCSPTVADGPPLPNDIAFDEAGNAYVTDSMQATIWRVPAGGGAPQVWFQDARLDTPFIGVNGIRLSPDRTRVFVSVTTDLLGGAYIYTLPLAPAPQPADLAVFHQFAPGDLPDGIAFGKSGDLYVTIATPLASGIDVLRPDGTIGASLRNPLPGAISPYDSPANVAFDGHGSLLVTNHAFATMIPSQFTLLSVYVGDTASPLAKPALP